MASPSERIITRQEIRKNISQMPPSWAEASLWAGREDLPRISGPEREQVANALLLDAFWRAYHGLKEERRTTLRKGYPIHRAEFVPGSGVRQTSPLVIPRVAQSAFDSLRRDLLTNKSLLSHPPGFPLDEKRERVLASFVQELGVLGKLARARGNPK